MKEKILNATESYLKGMIDKHKLNASILLEKRVGVAEHPDIIETLCQELGLMAEYEDKLNMLYEIE
jgi:hypothetical protein